MDARHNISALRDRRRGLRKNPTPQEEKLWRMLRNNNLGVKFKRQHSIGGYIADFYCRKYDLIIEIDGGVHNTSEAKEYDRVRDKYFTGLEYKVLRFSNKEVDTDIRPIIAKIKLEMRP